MSNDVFDLKRLKNAVVVYIHRVHNMSRILSEEVYVIKGSYTHDVKVT